MVWQLMFQSDDAKVDLCRGNDQVLEYLFEDVKRQVEKSAVSLLFLLLWLVERNDWGCSCVEQDEVTIISLATSLCSCWTLWTTPFYIIVPTRWHVVKIAYSVQWRSHIRSNR
jgi:hypothetical protein